MTPAARLHHFRFGTLKISSAWFCCTERAIVTAILLYMQGIGNKTDCSHAIYYLDFIHRPYVLQPQRFKGWFFPRHQVKPTLLGPVDRASLYICVHIYTYKVNWSRCTSWRRMWWEEYSSDSFLTSALDGGEWSASRPGRANPRGKDRRYPMYRRLGGPQSRSGRRG
jgi:hypothetical protein